MFDQSYSAALFVFEVLISHQGPIHISTLYLYFQAYLGNAHGYLNSCGLPTPFSNVSFADFIKFLQSFSSLFVIVGNYVCPASQLGLENRSLTLHQESLFADSACACLISPNPVLSTFSDPLLQTSAIIFFQNYLKTCGRYCYIPLQKLMVYLSDASPAIRAALPNLEALTGFLLQYPAIFHLKDGIVGLKKPRRNFRQIIQSNMSNGDSPGADLEVEVVISNSFDFAKTKPVILPASDFSVILVLRRILRQADNKNLHVADVIKQLIKFPSDIIKVVGLTRFEIHCFAEKYVEFFDILPLTADKNSSNKDGKQANLRLSCKIPSDFCLRINADALYMRSRIIDHLSSRCLMEKDTSKLECHVGFIFRVTKSWGIIDLGNHVHVFFDKSIFRNINDLHKAFQPNEMVYFNAVRASPRSRAKWRATRVWKSDDNDILQHVLGPTSKTSSGQMLHNSKVNCSGESGFVSCQSYGLPFLATSSCCKLKSRADSAPCLKIDHSTSSSIIMHHRCRSLDSLDSEVATKFRSDSEYLNNEDYSGYYLSDEDDSNIEIDPAKTPNDNLLPFIASNNLKRQIKLLHNTGGLLPDLEFPDSDISSWTPGDVDILSLGNGHNSMTTCNASTQTPFTGAVNSAEVFCETPCICEQFHVRKE